MNLIPKKLKKFFNKNKHKKRRSSGKKRKIIISVGLAWSLVFGSSRLISLRFSSQNQDNQSVYERIIGNEFNSLEDSHNSGEIIQTGTGTILAFQQKAHDSSSNEVLSEHNLLSNDTEEVILVKDDGILPGVDGFVPNTPKRPRRHPFGRPRMRGSSTINHPRGKSVPGLGNTPSIRVAPKIVDNGLNANRGDQCPAPEFNIKQEYQNFMQRIAEKGYNLNCTQERFNELATSPQTGNIDEKSLIETKGGLQGEAQGMYTNLRRPSNKDVDLDFEIDSSEGYTHADYKTPIDFEDLAEKKGIDVSNFPSLETVAYNMGKKIPAQKKEFCGLPDGPETPKNVLHVVNLDLIRDSNQKSVMITGVLNGAEDKGNDGAGINFLNY